MKFQIGAAILLVVALGVVGFLTGAFESSPQQPQPAQTAPTSEEKAMSTLKIN